MLSAHRYNPHPAKGQSHDNGWHWHTDSSVVTWKPLLYLTLESLNVSKVRFLFVNAGT